MPLADADKNAAAAAEALAELAEHGFVPRDDGAWSGQLTSADGGPVGATVTLPRDFPHAMPVVRVEAGTLGRAIPHRQVDGKLCLAPESGVLLDANNPRGIVRDALTRARRVVDDGLSGANGGDFISEFSAYWNAGSVEGFLSLIGPTGSARPVVVVRTDLPLNQQDVLAENLAAATIWLQRVGRKVVSHREVLFVPLSRPLTPHVTARGVSVDSILHEMQICSASNDYATLLEYLKRHRVPITLAFSTPLGPREGAAVAAMRIEEVTGTSRRHVFKSDGKTRRGTLWEIWCARGQPVTRLRVERVDPGFILPRGGTDSGLLQKRAVVVGCGSVGSRVAEHLAMMGIGHLTLIDPERLSPENLHRHLLGAMHLGLPKAAGVAGVLVRRFPHIQFEYRDEPIERTLAEHPEAMRDADVVVFALGDETVELRLNDLLANTAAVRVHAWLEPLGIGGHVLVCGARGRDGCYRCLFGWGGRFANAASFAEPGQQFRRTFSGCAGSFTPYAALDADRTALEAARAVVRVTSAGHNVGALISWFGDPAQFREQGFKLSARAAMFASGDCRATADFARHDCECCGRTRQ